jgi:hypothetical protein
MCPVEPRQTIGTTSKDDNERGGELLHLVDSSLDVVGG